MKNLTQRAVLSFVIGLAWLVVGTACQSLEPLSQAVRVTAEAEGPTAETTGELIVSFEHFPATPDLSSLLQTHSLKHQDTLTVGTTAYFLLRPHGNSLTDKSLSTLVAALRKEPGIRHVERNVRFVSPRFNDENFGGKQGVEGWWRKDTGVEKAWEYSIGTGVKAAYIDSGFTDRHPELQSRLHITEEANQTELAAGDRTRIDLPHGDHGTASLLVGFAERDNHIPSVGVAPNAEVMPFVASNIWEVSRALYAALRQKPDVVGINFAFPLYPEWEKFDEYEQYHILKAVFEANSRQGQIPIVVPAHNYGEPVNQGVRQWIPVSWAEEIPEILPVGGVQINGKRKLSAWFSDYLVTGINARGSNYGDHFIWAPALYLDIASTDPDSLKPGSMSGTSASCPFVTASVALLKSRFPNISAPRLRELLWATGEPISASALLQNPTATVPLIRLDKAFEAQFVAEQRASDTARAKVFEGELLYAPFRLRTAMRTYPLLSTRADMRAGTLPFAAGDAVQIEGWLVSQVGNDVLAEETLELLTIRRMP
jgi:hypothetical protein